jgi:hypothetical protein
MHQNISQCKLIDVGLALMNIHQLDDEDNFYKFFKKVENYILLTHDSFFKGRNLNGLIAIVIAFEGTD